MDMFLIIGRDGGLEISHEELVAALQQAADECQCPACTERRATEGATGIDWSKVPLDGKVPSDELLPADVLTDTYRAPGQGGWSQATSAVRLTHKPTGITVQCETERSAHANKAKAWEQLTAAVKQFNDRRAGLKNLITPQGGAAFAIEGEAGVELMPDQFAYVDHEAGTAIFEDINAADSRVRAELVKRGWTPPNEGGVNYPDIRRRKGGEGSGDLSYNEGWNACRIAVMQLNRKS